MLSLSVGVWLLIYIFIIVLQMSEQKPLLADDPDQSCGFFPDTQQGQKSLILVPQLNHYETTD